MTDVQELVYADMDTGEAQFPGPALKPDVEEWVTLARIDFNLLSTEMDVLIDVGRKLVDIHDGDRWVLGDIVYKLLQPRYGEGAIDGYADAIGYARSTVYQFRDVSRMFDELSTRLELREELPVLTWSHYYQVARVDTADSTDPLKRIDKVKQADLYELVREQELCVAISYLVSAQYQDQGKVWAARSKLRKEINAYLHKKPKAENIGTYEGSAEEILAEMTRDLLEGRFPVGKVKAVVSCAPSLPTITIDPLPEGMTPVYFWADPEDVERVNRLSSDAVNDVTERLP